MINGEIVTVEGLGHGSVERGTLEMNLEFSSIPPGFSIYCASLWTACCSTPTFAIEENGGQNMLTLSKGRYRCVRTFDFGRYGTYDYSYEIRLADSGETMTATGMINGTLDLPTIVGVKDSFTEMMIPVAADEVRSFSSTTFIAEDGSEVPVKVHGRYSPLAEDDADWTCCATNQVRKSFIDILRAEDPRLSLEYTTVVRGIDAPDLPEREVLAGATV